MNHFILITSNQKGKQLYTPKLRKHICTKNIWNLFINNQLRKNITQLRTSSHCLPIEYYQKKGIHREKRLCNLCETEIGTEIHVLGDCNNIEVSLLRQQLKSKLENLNPQWKLFNNNQMINLLLANEHKETLFYFAIFLEKTFKLVWLNYN